MALVRPRSGDQRGHLLLLPDLPVDEPLDVRMIGVADHHLRRAARGAAGLDGAGSSVADSEEAHQSRRFAAARERLALAAERGEVRAGARAVFEYPGLADPEIHDSALVHQVVVDRLDEAGVGLRTLVGRSGSGRLSGLVIDVEMALGGAVDAVGPVKAGVEPLGGVRRRALRREHMAHLVEIGARVSFGGEMAAFPSPVGPCAGEPVEDLPGRCLAAVALVLRQLGESLLVGDRAPEEFGNALLAHLPEPRRNAGLPEIFLGHDVARHLAPAFGRLHPFQMEDDRAVRIADLGLREREGHAVIGP